MQELGLVTETQFGQMFGQSGSQKSAFCLSNAYIEGYNNIVSDLNKFQGTELVSQQNVLEQYTLRVHRLLLIMKQGWQTKIHFVRSGW